jgi:hypothetical protein
MDQGYTYVVPLAVSKQSLPIFDVANFYHDKLRGLTAIMNLSPIPTPLAAHDVVSFTHPKQKGLATPINLSVIGYAQVAPAVPTKVSYSFWS